MVPFKFRLPPPPIHPVFVHAPIGNIIAAFVFGFVGLMFGKEWLGRASYVFIFRHLFRAGGLAALVRQSPNILD